MLEPEIMNPEILISGKTIALLPLAGMAAGASCVLLGLCIGHLVASARARSEKPRKLTLESDLFDLRRGRAERVRMGRELKALITDSEQPISKG